MIIDYMTAVECSNPEVFYTCYQCGKCGRVFEDGIMIDDGGTTVAEEEDEEIEKFFAEARGVGKQND